MRIEPNDDGLYTTKELLTMALNAVIAEFLNVDADRLLPRSRLVEDLGMSLAAKKRLQREIAFIFDSPEPDIPNATKVEDLVDKVANIALSQTEPVGVGGRLYKTGSGTSLTMVAS